MWKEQRPATWSWNGKAWEARLLTFPGLLVYTLHSFWCLRVEANQLESPSHPEEWMWSRQGPCPRSIITCPRYLLILGALAQRGKPRPTSLCVSLCLTSFAGTWKCRQFTLLPCPQFFLSWQCESTLVCSTGLGCVKTVLEILVSSTCKAKPVGFD